MNSSAALAFASSLRNAAFNQPHYCGDGFLDVMEQCDDGNISSLDGCSRTCQREASTFTSCGNGKLDAGEECEDSNAKDFDGCSTLCLLEQGRLGDGLVQSGLGEECDDGNRLSGDGCSPNGKIEALMNCGDGVPDAATEQCDTGRENSNTASHCRMNCLLPRCGDKVLDFNEECDDGNRFNGDGCNAYCELDSGAPPLRDDQTDDYTVRPDMQIPSPIETQTGPALLVFIATGAAAGVGFVRRKKR